jgi:pimeloyl-ACP methyl ester carboxylesterase
MLSYIKTSVGELNVFRLVKDNNKPTIVFLHDSLGCVKTWKDFPGKLGESTDFNVLVYDRQGYGASCSVASSERGIDYLEIEADILKQILDKYGIVKAILFGHSDGGSIALIAAAKYPAIIQAVITEGAHIFVEDITLAGIRRSVATYQHTNLQERLQKYHGSKTEFVFRAWSDTWLSSAYKNWNIEHYLPLIKCPLLIIQGENDEYGSLEQVKRISRQVSGEATELIISAIGHSPHKEAATIVLLNATSFLKQLPTEELPTQVSPKE